jgi:hypothetical protein
MEETVSVWTTKQAMEWVVFLLPYVMTAVFAIALVLRYLVYYTVKRHEYFAREFEKRVNKYVEGESPSDVKDVSFYLLSKKMLERTYYEVFELRDRMKRRKNDKIMSMWDRVFLIKQGSAWLVRDILKQLKFLKWTDDTPKLLNITKSTFSHNPCFNRVLGIFPIGSMNDLLSILPGLFVVAGILGTFIGIRAGLGSLGTMSLDNLDATKKIMDHFLGEIAFAMSASVLGIFYSLSMHVFNTIFNPDRGFYSMIERFEGSLDLLWYRSDNNSYPRSEKPFDENRDPLEALAEQALDLEVSKQRRTRDMDQVHSAPQPKKPKAS